MVAGETDDGLVGNRLERGMIQREIRGEPGVLGEGEHMAKRRAFGNSARDEIGGLQRKLWRAPALRQRR